MFHVFICLCLRSRVESLGPSGHMRRARIARTQVLIQLDPRPIGLHLASVDMRSCGVMSEPASSVTSVCECMFTNMQAGTQSACRSMIYRTAFDSCGQT